MGDLDRDSDSVGCQVKRYEVHETLVPIPYGSSEDTGKALISPISGDIAEAKEEEILIPPLSEETPKEEKIISPIFEDQSDLKDENLIPSLSEENLNEETQREEVIKGETPEEETLILTIYEDQPELKVIPWEDFQNTLAKFCGSDSDISQLRARREELSKKLESSLHVILCFPVSFCIFIVCLIRSSVTIFVPMIPNFQFWISNMLTSHGQNFYHYVYFIWFVRSNKRSILGIYALCPCLYFHIGRFFAFIMYIFIAC